jgi:hypothetical protein
MKRLILALLVFASAVSGFGQKHIKLSFTGSPAINWMSTNSTAVKSGNPTFGYDFGVNTDFYFSEDERYSILTGLLITNAGGELNYQNGSGFTLVGLPVTGNVKYKLRYVEIPLCLKLKTGQFNRVSYWGQLGITTMVNIDSKGFSDDSTLDKTNIKDEINLFNLDMNMGIGFDYDLSGNNSITTGIIFQNGLMDVTSDNNTFTDKTVINSLKLKIGVNF